MTAIEFKRFEKKWNDQKPLEKKLLFLKSKIQRLYINKELISFLEFVSNDLVEPESRLFILRYCQKVIQQYPRQPIKDDFYFAFEDEIKLELNDDEQQLFQPSVWCDSEIKYLEATANCQDIHLIKSKPNAKQSVQENDLMTLEDTMKLLKMSKSTIDRRRFDGMPFEKIGKKLFFRRSDIDRWIKANQN